MARRPDGNVSRKETLSLRVTTPFREQVDKQRGQQSRSEYLRGLVEKDANRKGTS